MLYATTRGFILTHSLSCATNCRGCPQFSRKPKAQPHVSDKQSSLTTCTSIHPRPGRDTPHSLRRGPPGLPTAAAVPPAPLRSAPPPALTSRSRRQAPLRHPRSPAAVVRRLLAARPVGAAPLLGTCEGDAGCVPDCRPGVRRGA